MKFKSENELKAIIKEFENLVSNANNNVSNSNQNLNNAIKLQDKLILDNTQKNLYLHLRFGKKEISKSFVFRYSFKSKILSITLGKYPLYSLNEARNKAKELNTILVSYEYKSSNTDLKNYLNNAIYKKISFNAMCDKWINSKNVRDITLKRYIFRINILKQSKYFNKDIDKISKLDIINFLKEYEKSNKLAMLKEYYNLLKQVFNYALNYDYIAISPFQKINYSIIFKAYKVTHYKALNEFELKELLNKLNNSISFNRNNIINNINSLILKFMIYTPLRIKNILSLTWNEINFKENMLYIKANNMKNHKDFKLPLCKQALEILYYLQDMYNSMNIKSNYVFIHAFSQRKVKAINLHHAFIEYMQYYKTNDCNVNKCKIIIKYNELCNKYNINKLSFIAFVSKNKESYLQGTYTTKTIQNKIMSCQIFGKYVKKHFNFNPHSIRGTFSTILYEKTPLHNKDLTIIEMCLSHNIGNQIIASYNHSERLNERKELMEFWANYIDSLIDSKELKKISNDSYIFNPNDTLRF